MTGVCKIMKEAWYKEKKFYGFKKLFSILFNERDNMKLHLIWNKKQTRT